MFSLNYVCYSENLVDQFFELIFYLTFIYLSLGFSRFWWTPTVRGRVAAVHNFVWTLHGPSMTLIPLFCHTYGWLKYLGGTVLMLTIWTFGEDCIDEFGKWDFKTLHLLVTMNMHHHGGIIAFYFQQPEDAWLNMLLFGHFWWIHSYSLFQIEDKIKSAWQKITGYECTKFGHGYACFTVLFCAIYCYYMPIGLNYQAAAISCMTCGRWLVMDNHVNIDWMGYIEVPGVMFFVICKAIGWKTAMAVVTAYAFYYHRRKQQSGDTMVKPPRFIMTDKIQKFLDSYPRQEKDENKIKAGIVWFDGQFKKGELPVFRAVVESDEVKLKDLIDNGADPNAKEPKWQSTPFHWVASGGKINCACVLLEAGVNPFGKGVRKSARQWGQHDFLKFLDELTPLVWEALREEFIMRHELQEEPGMTWEMANELAKAKGGRLCTVEEAEKYLLGAPLVESPQWCAITDSDGKQKWIQVGNKFFEFGKIEDNRSEPEFWGNNLEHNMNIMFKANRMLLWTVDSDDIETEACGVQNGA